MKRPPLLTQRRSLSACFPTASRLALSVWRSACVVPHLAALPLPSCRFLLCHGLAAAFCFAMAHLPLSALPWVSCRFLLYHGLAAAFCLSLQCVGYSAKTAFDIFIVCRGFSLVILTTNSFIVDYHALLTCVWLTLCLCQ